MAEGDGADVEYEVYLEGKLVRLRNEEQKMQQRVKTFTKGEVVKVSKPEPRGSQ